MTSINKVDARSVKLYLLKRGQGPSLVFIHGWAATHRFWKHQLAFFSQSHQMLAYDLRGHGDSEKPKTGYLIKDHVMDLERLLIEQQIFSPVLVGHSLGGMIALRYTLKYPLKPKAIVLVGTSPHPGASWKRSIQFSFLRFLIRLSRKRASKLTERALFAPDVSSKLVEWVNAESLRTPTYVILQILKGVKKFNVVSQLSEIQQPTLIVYGEFETAVQAPVLAQMQKSMLNARVQMITGAGHNCMLEQPSQFNSALELFLHEIQE